VLAANGALVVLAARRVERLKELRAQIEAAGGEAHVVALDVTDQDDPRGDRRHRRRGRADRHPGQQLRRVDAAAADRGVAGRLRPRFRTNVRGAFFVAQAVARQMIARAKARRTSAAASSTSPRWPGLRVLPQIGLYCMSKAAVCT
jgi:NADP-dependent 3-hydroxy acid dehydrogenase YdfG